MARRDQAAPGTGRELVVLDDGPWARRWYWRDDLEAMQAASRHVGHPDTHAAGELRRYLPTDTHQAHPHHPGRSGRVYAFGPAHDGDPVTEHDEQASDHAAAPDRPAVGPVRVLVTGSRDWTDTTAVRDGLAAVWGDGGRVLVVGGCPTGADALAEQCWRAWGGQVEVHPADWDAHGRTAGPRRNAEMVGAGAEVCVAFIRDGSPGATHTAGLAEAAGIRTHRHLEPAEPVTPAVDGGSSAAGLVDAAHRVVTAIPAPRRPLDDEASERERQRSTHHEQQATERTENGAEKEGVLW